MIITSINLIIIIYIYIRHAPLESSTTSLFGTSTRPPRGSDDDAPVGVAVDRKAQRATLRGLAEHVLPDLRSDTPASI